MTKHCFNVLVIGAGQMGSRHLQGLAKINQDIRITVVDPNYNALELSKKRFEEMPSNSHVCSVFYEQDISKLYDKVDLAIIATNADVRRSVIENLLSKVHVRYFILEKVVFQSTHDFESIIALLEEEKIKTWVNCPRRMFSFFQELKKRTVNAPKVNLTVKGSRWGLGSNTIHMLDLIAFLSGQTKFEIDASNLYRQVFNTKRKGFIELGGELLAESQRGDILQLVDRRNHEISMQMFIQFNGVEIEVDQRGGRTCEYPSGRRVEVVSKAFLVPLQSELTNFQVEEILQTGSSHLITLDESYLLHKPMLECFNRHLSSLNKKQISVCPIS